MNFVRRAGMSLRARKSRTAALLGIFVVICCLLLGGFVLEAAAARQAAEAQRTIGVDVTIEGKRLTSAVADRLGSRSPVTRYNPLLPLTAVAHGFDPLVPPEPKSRGDRGDGSAGGPLALRGVRDLGMLLPFSYGSTKITSGRGIVPQDVDRAVAVIEERLAASNGLRVGDTVQVGSVDGRHQVSVKVLGVFQDPRPDPSQWTPSNELPGNTLYVPTSVGQRLGGGAAGLDEAVFKIGSPEQAERLHAEAKRLLGTGDFTFRVNDKAYRDQVRPVQRVGAFAGLIVWVIALAGALILGLIVMLQIRERRQELGVLLSMGEKKWKLVLQHVVEAAVVCLPAVAVAALTGHVAGPSVGAALLDRPQPNTVAAGVADAEVAPSTVRVDPTDVGKVAGLGLGICLLSTVVPGLGILRLHPRSILAGSE
ncbi:ABC transporter permease [Streptomyces sp. S.PB5]|uniref:ABC transporter permease n=1 Tax=Streptomyces sp. S.PB5 TaxID=3020844 RepID=UPI0025AF9452|nr:ABC transporter permease [Streptomyces sp. S.PB5]MDN3027070.1 ABC transporter permease [Streptomyces sp. S.PB5]